MIILPLLARKVQDAVMTDMIGMMITDDHLLRGNIQTESMTGAMIGKALTIY